VIGKSVTILIPEDRYDEEPVILERIRSGERVEPYDTVRRRKDGSLVDISLTVSPIMNAAGRVIGASKIARDVSERKRAQERQVLLLQEMSHRIKNLFALAGSVVALSARAAHDVKSLVKAVQERLGALARAHELTLPNLQLAEGRVETATTLGALLQAILAPFDSGKRQAGVEVRITGPDIPIGGHAATSFALLLHEFASNAAKYGAVSSAGGCIEVSWFAEEGALRLTWSESGRGHLEGPPQTEGFGSFLTRAIVSGQLKGQISQDWKPGGLTIHMSVPLERLGS
jgi:two-component sensor histidine kinase